MAGPLRLRFSTWCRDVRTDLDITQQQLADAVGVSRSLIAAYETGRAVPDLDMVDRIGQALDVRIDLVLPAPLIRGGAHERDLLHARCSGHIHRRMESTGWLTAREVEVVDGRAHGWIDLLAFDPRSGRLVIIEIKTSLDDLGAIERQIGWYERLGPLAANDRGWAWTSVSTWLLVLATAEVDDVVARQHDLLDRAFPLRAADLRRMRDGEDVAASRGLALIDPARRRREWLLPTRRDGRRTAAPYATRHDAIRVLRGRPP